ncbi:hypothetical protein [Rickettsia endosymbiont of Gonocerus acuteangulatus]|uniref:hypothetical protein n=1 Tax=Rickettsia endosymbiont of Gonocerus acuteangulatus TaxID=3066266 RepID=UPI0031331160
MLIPPYYAASGGEYTQKRLKRKGVIKDQIIPYDSRISIILESIEEVNKQLEKGGYLLYRYKKRRNTFIRQW